MNLNQHFANETNTTDTIAYFTENVAFIAVQKKITSKSSTDGGLIFSPKRKPPVEKSQQEVYLDVAEKIISFLSIDREFQQAEFLPCWMLE